MGLFVLGDGVPTWILINIKAGSIGKDRETKANKLGRSLHP
jgi:hypothetical protein